MTDCVADYITEIDSIERKRWEEHLLKFDDASINQTWSMGKISFGENDLSHLVLRRDGEVIGMAQIRIRKLPIIGTGIATLYWGPLWRRKGRPVDYVVLDKMIEALKNEYVTNRGLLMRIWPIGFEKSDHGEATISILKKYGFTHNVRVQQYRTLILSLNPTLEELRLNLARNWRQAMTRAERFPSIELECGSSNELYGIALDIYNEMHDRKRFSEHVDMETQGLIQKDLPRSLKMKIMICRLKGEPIAALGWSTIGDTGRPLINAAGNKAVSLSTNASNLLWWKMIEDMKSEGCIFCDLGGIAPELNPGGYKFKIGLAGKLGRDVRHIGQFYLATNLYSYFLNICINRINTVRAKLHSGLQLFYRRK